METALENRIPKYRGGLAVLPGDTLRAAADVTLPMAGASLHRRGSFAQRLDRDGTQHEEAVA
jgi:starch phosphorylase